MKLMSEVRFCVAVSWALVACMTCACFIMEHIRLQLSVASDISQVRSSMLNIKSCYLLIRNKNRFELYIQVKFS